jgi:hypothetical protein
MNVRISERGRRLLNNKELGSQLVHKIIEKRDQLSSGQTIDVDGQWSVKLTTAIKEKPKR